MGFAGTCLTDFQPAEEGKDKSEDLRRHREHLAAALHALQTLLEAQPRLSAIMASTAALAPFCNCIEPICRQACCVLPSQALVKILALRLGIRCRELDLHSSNVVLLHSKLV